MDLIFALCLVITLIGADGSESSSEIAKSRMNKGISADFKRIEIGSNDNGKHDIGHHMAPIRKLLNSPVSSTGDPDGQPRVPPPPAGGGSSSSTGSSTTSTATTSTPTTTWSSTPTTTRSSTPTTWVTPSTHRQTTEDCDDDDYGDKSNLSSKKTLMLMLLRSATVITEGKDGKRPPYTDTVKGKQPA